MGTEFVFVQQMIVLAQQMEQNLQHMLNPSLDFQQRWTALQYAKCQIKAMDDLVRSFNYQLESVQRVIVS